MLHILGKVVIKAGKSLFLWSEIEFMALGQHNQCQHNTQFRP